MSTYEFFQPAMRCSGARAGQTAAARVRLAIIVCLALPAAQLPAVAMALDEVERYPVSEGLAELAEKGKDDIAMHFSGQSHPGIAKSLGVYSTRKTRAGLGVHRKARRMCKSAFMSAVLELRKRALTEGGDAVVNIVSITTGQEYESADKFVCRYGRTVAKVYLRGEVVTIAKPGQPSGSAGGADEADDSPEPGQSTVDDGKAGEGDASSGAGQPPASGGEAEKADTPIDSKPPASSETQADD